MRNRILLVDDEEPIRVMLQEFLGSIDYEVETAEDGVDALEKLAMESFDLVLSDINMPRMKGFELLKIVKEKYPAIKRALITAYDVNDYLSFALEEDVGNIIPKTTPFSFDEVETVVGNLINENFFGLARYLKPGTTIESAPLVNLDNITATAAKVASLMEDKKTRHRTDAVLTELLTNAMFYGARKEETSDKEKWETEFELPQEKAIFAHWGIDDEKFGFSVVDNEGRLKKKDVLYWMCRQVQKDENNMPLGVFDTHGRGFFIARNYVDSLIVNIKVGVQTEILGLNYLQQGVTRHKPLYINEI